MPNRLVGANAGPIAVAPGAARALADDRIRGPADADLEGSGPLDGQVVTVPVFTGARPNPNFLAITEISNIVESIILKHA